MIDSGSTTRRLLKDLQNVVKDPPYGITGFPVENNLFLWHCQISGQVDSNWEHVHLQLEVTFPESYPQDPPKIKFMDKMFHPNVYQDGSICLDLLNDKWQPTYGVVSILQSVQMLLSVPNPNSPANAEAAQLLTQAEDYYNKRVQKLFPLFLLNKKH